MGKWQRTNTRCSWGLGRKQEKHTVRVRKSNPEVKTHHPKRVRHVDVYSTALGDGMEHQTLEACYRPTKPVRDEAAFTAHAERTPSLLQPVASWSVSKHLCRRRRRRRRRLQPYTNAQAPVLYWALASLTTSHSHPTTPSRACFGIKITDYTQTSL